jgi:DNA-binding transcriptional LysR family regulator
VDRLDEWRVFAQVATRRSFADAARAQGRSPQAVTRAVASLEARLGTRLLLRTTRSVSLTDEGARYLARARTLLAELDALEAPADRDAPLAGTVTLAASVLFGQRHVLPVVVEMARAHPGLDLRLVLHDRVVSLAEEGIDVAVRLGELPDSSLRARRVGEVRQVVCASPAYLKRAGTPGEPSDLARHDGIAFAGTTAIPDRWSFAASRGAPGPSRKAREQVVRVRPRLQVNTAQAAIDAALAGLGVVRVLSYQVEAEVRARRLRVVLADFEPAPLPVHVVQLPGVASRTASVLAELLAARLPARLRPLPR